jgi:transposase
MWVATQDLPRSAAHPFYARLNQILEQHGFDGYVEGLCERFYADDGRPGLPPGRYFRLLLIGYFEGLDAERAIAWRAADSFALREFLGLVLPEAPPDHSTISRTRRLIDLETHEAVFTWMLQRLADAGLVKGKTVGIDATTLEANAALRSIVRRDTGESYQDFLTMLAQASGIETPTRADLARIDRKRKKKGSNDDWTHPHDADAKITKMKDGRTYLAHKAEHAVDLETGAIVSVTVQDADDGDTTTSIETLIDAAEHVDAVQPDGKGLEEVVGDKGYHSNQSLVDLEAVGVRSYISEPDRGRRNWKKNPEARNAVYRNRRRSRHGDRTGNRSPRRRSTRRTRVGAGHWGKRCGDLLHNPTSANGRPIVTRSGIILLVEDNPDDVDLTLRAFEKSNVRNEILVVRDGAEALEYLFGTGTHAGRDAAQTPEVILLDLNLPKIDGLEVLRRLRGDERTRRLPVVVLTSSKEERDVLRSYDLGATASSESRSISPSSWRQRSSSACTGWWSTSRRPYGQRPRSRDQSAMTEPTFARCRTSSDAPGES